MKQLHSEPSTDRAPQSRSNTDAGITLTCIGRFHHFHLARQLEERGLLKEIWTGYPRRQLKSEQGIPEKKIRTFPWLQAPYMAAGRLKFQLPAKLAREWQWLAQTTLDRHVLRSLSAGNTLIALSGSGLESGRFLKRSGGTYICDRGSTHIRAQDGILREEYRRWNLDFDGVDPRMIEREEAEYSVADCVSVPSTFVAQSFLRMGHPADKLFVNPYGARLERFRPVAEPPGDTFQVIFVGHVSLRKGVLYLLAAFEKLKHPRKRLKIIGRIAPEVAPLLSRYDLTCVEFLNQVPNEDLPAHYSTAHVMVLPSIEEGLAMVIGEALACGCPVVASENTGASDFMTDTVEGFIVAPRSVEALHLRLEALAQDIELRKAMSSGALKRVKKIGGWAEYGNRWGEKIDQKKMGVSSS